jgi:RNA polymerase sigma factor (sigma-70 family)
MTAAEARMTNDPASDPGADPLAALEDWQDGALLERFLTRRDQGAFLVLVRRHGPMILGACRRILTNSSDVDDAFQTVFLVLLRKANELRGRATLGNWLYGVAFHTALKVRALAMKRRVKESAALPRNTSQASPDLAEAIDSELARLPEKYREPLVLCDLEDLPRKAVAEKLGIPEGTLSSRLTTARKMLGDRLLKKGLVVPVAGLSAVAVPAALEAATTQVAAIAAGHIAGIVPVALTELTRQVTLSLYLAKLQVAALCMGATVLLVLATGVIVHSFAPDTASRPNEPAPKFATSVIAGTGRVFQTYGIAQGRSVTLTSDGCLLDIDRLAGWGHVGARATLELHGDVQFEASYEILHAPARIDAGYGAHIGLALDTGDQAAGAGAVNRGVFQSRGNQYDACRWLRISDRLRYPTSFVSTHAVSGRLAVRRIGSEVIMLAADDPAADLAEIDRYHFTGEPVQSLSIYGDTGGANVDLQARIYDVKLFIGTDVPRSTTRHYDGVISVIDRGPAPESDPANEETFTAPERETSSTPVMARLWLPVVTLLAGVVVGVFIGRGWKRR